jgi:hypothetical protein
MWFGNQHSREVIPLEDREGSLDVEPRAECFEHAGVANEYRPANGRHFGLQHGAEADFRSDTGGIADGDGDWGRSHHGFTREMIYIQEGAGQVLPETIIIAMWAMPSARNART